ncbi:hypothetical protein CLV63_102363 [Murinocardiopsis flavida]|uniref:NmrA-like family protein n=1 Tax=Murinocardiopsis flavida TaxID=645275 RepID=A0A2P8DSP0_9ACTN|nr:hypothetical protein [Murinocardiopsis flavida]PSL00236.1 hypothetical protein CLV63_102363 [Murinocardiopsis flavida]
MRRDDDRAARDSGVRRVVAVSQLAAGPDAPTPHMRRHWLAEQVLDWAGIGAVHLRAAVFFENLAVLVRVGGGRELALPLGTRDTVLPLIAADDVARVAAGILTDPGPGPGPGPGSETEPVHLLTGALEIYGDPVAVEHLSKLWEIFRLLGAGHDLFQVTGAIERFGGAPPVTLDAWTAQPADT